ncbi:MAG: YbjN domain-containing protein [Acidobacteria bacterium]|nr:YbjN domain-containing protein [Acidobacteriota bacterium]
MTAAPEFLGTIPESELAAVLSHLSAFNPTEELGEGVLLTCVDGRRTWQLASDDVCATIRGGRHPFTGAYLLPGRVVQAADRMVPLGGECAMHVADGGVTIEVRETLRAAYSLGTAVPRLRTFGGQAVVRARLPFNDLKLIASLIGDLPMDPTDFEEMAAQPPYATIRVHHGRIEMLREWAYMGASDVVLSATAETDGLGSFMVNILSFDAHLSMMQIDDSPRSEVMVSFDPGFGDFLAVEGDSFSLHFARRSRGAASYFDRLIAALESGNIDHRTDSEGIVAAMYRGIPMRLQLLDGDGPVLRCTATVLHGVPPSEDLLRELNLLNSTRVSTRVWLDNNMVVVGSDVRFDDSRSPYPTLTAVANEARHLGRMLRTAFGGTAPGA